MKYINIIIKIIVVNWLSLNRDGEDEIITDYYRHQNYLRNSSPYISENGKRLLEDKENKKHFLKLKIL